MMSRTLIYSHRTYLNYPSLYPNFLHYPPGSSLVHALHNPILVFLQSARRDQVPQPVSQPRLAMRSLSSISLKDPIFCSFKCPSMHPCMESFALLLPPHSIHRQLTSSFRVRYHLVSPVNYIPSFATTYRI